MLNPLPLQVHDDGPGFHLGFPALDPPDRRILNDTGMTEAAWTHVTAPRFRWPSALLAMVQALAEPRNSVRRTYSRGEVRPTSEIGVPGRPIGRGSFALTGDSDCRVC